MVATPNSLGPDNGNVYQLNPKFKELVDFNVDLITSFLTNPHPTASANLRLDPTDEWNGKTRTVPEDDAHLFLLDGQLLALGADLEKPIDLGTRNDPHNLGKFDVTAYEIAVPNLTDDPDQPSKAWLEVDKYGAIGEGERRVGRIGLRILRDDPRPPEPVLPYMSPEAKVARVREALEPETPKNWIDGFMRNWVKKLARQPRQHRNLHDL